MKRLIFLILSIVVIFGALYTVQNYNKSSNNSSPSQISQGNSNSGNGNSNTINNNAPEINQGTIKVKATDFKLKDLTGKEVSLSDFKGKNVYLNFWATWCPPCRGEMPDIEKLYEETKDSNLVILGVDLGEDSSTVKSFIDNNKYNFKILLDSDQSVAAKYNINAIPTSFFIDKNGVIVSKKVGAMTLDEMKEYVKTLDK